MDYTAWYVCYIKPDGVVEITSPFYKARLTAYLNEAQKARYYPRTKLLGVAFDLVPVPSEDYWEIIEVETPSEPVR